MKNLKVNKYDNVIVIERSDYKWGILDLNGNIIVPYGKYDWIDGFEGGLARVKIGTQPSKMANNNNKWGIINDKGEEVLPVEYDEIWNFYNKNRTTTKAIRDKEETNINLNKLRDNFDEFNEDDRYYDDRIEHYGEYAGTYAQDVAGYSDEDINDAFDGEPDAYWNID